MKTWLPVLLCASVFAVESTAGFGADHTSGPLHSLVRGVTGMSGGANWIDQNWTHVHHFLRKIGHFCGYGMFSLVCFRGFWMSLRGRMSGMDEVSRQGVMHLFAMGATIAVASADEIHQTFLPNRTGTFADVVLDACGALTVQLALFLLLRYAAKRNPDRGQERRKILRGVGLTPMQSSLRTTSRRRKLALVLRSRAAFDLKLNQIEIRQSRQRLDPLHG